MADAEELPRTIVRRVVKGKLAELTKDMVDKKEISVHKEAVIAFSEAAKVFIHYLSATANDLCRESKRQTINAEDVLKAIEDTDFIEFLEPLRAALEEFRKDNAIKKSEAKEKGQEKKRKSEVVNACQENVEVADKSLDSENAPLSKEDDVSPLKDNGDRDDHVMKDS
ncbi:hypothetical protein GOP47_0012485 [Adiantum capillus-veneris]|uniref:Core Histone H2A/H2B/H3 domain-containing protein n=1 Tax=Adiantum capillus-veneris TaxID=13818 RepID=A0A9D4UQR7_ADICA|nr:hypothetical protein GOP47_0012485 [Adiantum capillus-veneris]